MQTCLPSFSFSFPLYLSLSPHCSLSWVTPPPPIISNQREPSTSQSNRPATLQPSGTCSHIEERVSYYKTHKVLQLSLSHTNTHTRLKFDKEVCFKRMKVFIQRDRQLIFNRVDFQEMNHQKVNRKTEGREGEGRKGRT